MFTIIVPVYNTSKYLDNCLKSIQNQSFAFFEAIIINDGSTDNSINIIKKYTNKDKRFKIINQENSGLSAARNKGILEAKNKYLVFVDSDDTINHDLLLNLNNEIIKEKSDIVRYGVKIINQLEENKFKFNILKHKPITGMEAIKQWSISGITYALPWIYAIKKDIFIDNNLFFTINRVHEDYLLMPFLISNAKRVSTIDYIGYNYLIRSGGISLPNSEQKLLRNLKDFVLCYKDIINNIDKMNLSDEVKQIFLSDQYYRLLKEMIKSKYEIRIEIMNEMCSNIFNDDDISKIYNKDYTKKMLKRKMYIHK